MLLYVTFKLLKAMWTVVLRGNRTGRKTRPCLVGSRLCEIWYTMLVRSRLSPQVWRHGVDGLYSIKINLGKHTTQLKGQMAYEKRDASPNFILPADSGEHPYLRRTHSEAHS